MLILGLNLSIFSLDSISKVGVSILIPKSGTHLMEKCLALIGLKRKLVRDISELDNRNYDKDVGYLLVGVTTHLVYNLDNEKRLNNSC